MFCRVVIRIHIRLTTCATEGMYWNTKSDGLALSDPSKYVIIKYNLPTLFLLSFLSVLQPYVLFKSSSWGAITFVKSNSSVQEAPHGDEMRHVQRCS